MGLVTTAAAARELAVSVRTLNRWARDGVVRPAFTTPGRRGGHRWDLEDLRRQLANRQETTP